MKEKEIPTHPGFPIFVRHIEDVMKNILDLPPSTLLPLALIILYCVCVCLRVCRREEKMRMEMPETSSSVCHQELCGSIADRPQGRCSTQSHTSRGRH